MKKIITLAFCCLFTLGIFAQSSDFVTQVIKTDKINYSQAAYLIGCEMGLIQEDASPKEAVFALTEKYPEFIKTISGQNEQLILTAKQFSFICTRVYNIKTSLMYMIFQNPRYAFRELKAQRYFDSSCDPNANVSGRTALLIIATLSEKYNRGEK